MAAKPNSKYKITPVEAQRLRLEALERWFQFINCERAIAPENFKNELLFPTFWSVRAKGFSLTGPSLTTLEVEEIRTLIMKGIRKIADKETWIVYSRDLGDFETQVSTFGTRYAGHARTLSQLGVLALFYGEEWRAHSCAWCGKVFVKKHRGEYCGKNCSQRMRTFKTRNQGRWEGVLKAAQRARQPIAAYLLAQREKLLRYLTICPVCKHEFEVREIPMSVQCPNHKGYFIAGPLNTKSVEEK